MVRGRTIDWTAIEPDLIQLYRDDGWSLARAKRTIEDRHHVEISVRSYRSKLKELHLLRSSDTEQPLSSQGHARPHTSIDLFDNVDESMTASDVAAIPLGASSLGPSVRLADEQGRYEIIERPSKQRMRNESLQAIADNPQLSLRPHYPTSNEINVLLSKMTFECGPDFILPQLRSVEDDEDGSLPSEIMVHVSSHMSNRPITADRRDPGGHKTSMRVLACGGIELNQCLDHAGPLIDVRSPVSAINREEDQPPESLVYNDVSGDIVMSSRPRRKHPTERSEELPLMAIEENSTPRSSLSQASGAGVSSNGRVYTLTMSRSPSAPRALLIPENLFRGIKVYFENSCRSMMFDDSEILLSPDGTELRMDLCNDFDSYCFTATMLKGKGLHVECCRALSKASALVERIVRAEHPRTLPCFFEVLIHLMQTGLPEVAFILRDFIKGMSAIVNEKKTLSNQIYGLLGELDPEVFAHAMGQAWKCTTDVFDSVLGSSNRLAVAVRLDYIKRVITDDAEEERLLRGVLGQSRGILARSTPRVMLNLAHSLNRQARHQEAETMALDVFLLLQEHEMYAASDVERIDSLKALSRSQCMQGKRLEAERSMRVAIRMIEDLWGQQHPWALEFRNVLEDWLRGWGREVEANILRGEIEGLIAPGVSAE